MKEIKRYVPFLSFVAILLVIMLAFVPSFSHALLTYHNKIKTVLTSSYEINGWILLFLIVFSIIGFCFVLYKLYYTKPAEVFYADYKSEIIKNALWKWQWIDNQIEYLWCYCPTCNSELAYESDHLLFQTKFTCHTCNKEIMKLEGSNINYILKFIKREIRRNIQRKLMKKQTRD